MSPARRAIAALAGGLAFFPLAPPLAASFPEVYNTEKGGDGPMPAAEAARTARLPDGFRLEVFASEPDVMQPIGMCFDEAGRLWVAECFTYAETPLRWDLNLRDRVIVLEDTDGDGVADRRTVFWDEGKRLTGISHGHGGVWVLCAPELLFIPDADGDLKPDGPPRVVLDGFEAETIGHNVVNGLKWGPDGWLYGRHGITATSAVGEPGAADGERARLNCSIWRYHPARRVFEVVCHGGTNPWGMDWNRDGQLFFTNTVIGHLWHAIPGAWYERMFGAPLNARAYELIPQTADHLHWDHGSEKWSDVRGGVTSRTAELGGGHAHMGCLIYQGGVWPAGYEGQLFTINLHGRRINVERLERDGCGYTGRHEPDFLQMEDPWFRGLDLVTGPDGQVWMNDWSDTGECHDNDGIHRTSGRIYRIVFTGADPGAKAATRPDWLARRARNGYDLAGLRELAAHEYEGRRAMAVRWLAEDHAENAEVARLFKGLAETERSGLVRLELAAALQRLPSTGRFELAGRLARVAEDADDRQQGLMIWYGVADAVPLDSGSAVKLALASRLPTVTRLVSRRLAEEIERQPEAVESLLAGCLEVGAIADAGQILRGVAAGLRGWTRAPRPRSWEAFARVADGGDEELRGLVSELEQVFGAGRGREELLALARDAHADAGARRSALEALLRQPDEALLPHLKSWTQDRVLAADAARGLALYDDPEAAARLVEFWVRNPLERPLAMEALVSRATHAGALVAAMEKGRVPRSQVSAFAARQILSLGDAELSARLRAVWGEIGETNAVMQAEIQEWKSRLTPEVLAAADLGRGHELFTQRCATCHKLRGEGNALGPDLTGSDRRNLDYLLGNIINPGEVVPADYRLTVLTLADGRVLSGVVPEESERVITLQTPAGSQTVERSEVRKREVLPVSLMPEGLFKDLSLQDARDLTGFLME
jgi:putative membrane-bound dehydrogenase-like protein